MDEEASLESYFDQTIAVSCEINGRNDMPNEVFISWKHNQSYRDALHVLITNEVIINKKIYIFKRKYQILKHIWNITTEIEKID